MIQANVGKRSVAGMVRSMARRAISVIDFMTGEGELDLPVGDLPEIVSQKRKRPATNSWSGDRMVGADTETIEGCVWLFSTEHGVWEINKFTDLIHICSDKDHSNKWARGRGARSTGTSRGISPHEFFFWNLAFDVNAVLKLLSERSIYQLMKDGETTINTDTGDWHPKIRGRMAKLSYLEGKMFEIEPVDWKRGQYKIGKITWWDASPLYHKTRLNTAAKQNLNKEKVEICFDGTKLDAGRFDDPEYRDMYAEDIDKYALEDAILCGELARLARDRFVENNIRFIKPYSVANIAQRALLDTCKIPRIDPWLLQENTISMLAKALEAYDGGWFETAGSGFVPRVTEADLTSAYPYVMRFLKNPNLGHWVQGDEEEAWWDWMDQRLPFDMGFCEAVIMFEDGLPWHPLVTKTTGGTLVAPRYVRGWFTADEIAEAIQWPHTQFWIGEWFYHACDEEEYPFRSFIDHHYEIKMNTPKGTPAYDVSKVMLNSVYGKTIQCVNDRTGKLWNPLWAATITGATRARMAELNRVNGFKALSFATDGIVFRSADLQQIPRRPRPAPHNLGEWEVEMEGDALFIMSGVYSIKGAEKCKTTFRGTAAYFIRDMDPSQGLFEFVDRHGATTQVRKQIRRPWSLREAAFRDDLTLVNVFDIRNCSITPLGDSTKRIWPSKPVTFNDLASQWWTSKPHSNNDLPDLLSEEYDAEHGSA